MIRPRATPSAIACAARATPWLVAALAVALRHPPPRELAPPAACPTVLELLSVAAVQLDARLSLGTWFAALHAIAIGLAVAALVQLVVRTTGSRAAALAVGLASALGPAFSPTLAPPWAAASFAAAASLALVLVGPTRRSVAVAAVALAVVLAAPLIVPPASPSAPGPWRVAIACLQPGLGDGATDGAMAAAAAAASASGPVVLSLAVLGAYALWFGDGRRLLAVAAGLGSAGAMFAAWRGSSASLPLGFMLAAAWCLAAAGIAKLVERAGTGWSRAGVAVLVVLLPVLQLARAHGEIRDDQQWPIGHSEATRRFVREQLDQVPSNGAVVEEDASLDVLLRALSGRIRDSGKALPIVPRVPDQVEAAVRTGRAVLAWPLARRDLTLRGFTFEVPAPVRAVAPEEPSPEMPARVAGRLPCRAVAADWSDVSDVLSTDRLAFVARAEEFRGPIALVIGGRAEVVARVGDWPARARRGFHARRFTAPETDQDAARAAWARAQDLPPDLPPLAEPNAVRLVLFRTPRAPLALLLTIDGRPARAFARLDRPAASPGAIMLCAVGQP
jgi:hypothetical protein